MDSNYYGFLSLTSSPHARGDGPTQDEEGFTVLLFPRASALPLMTSSNNLKPMIEFAMTLKVTRGLLRSVCEPASGS